MSVFRRGTKRSAPDGSSATEAPDPADGGDVDATDAAAAAGEATDGTSSDGSDGTDAEVPFVREGGPWDVNDVADELARVDLGAILLPAVQGMELRMETDKTTQVVSAVSVVLDESALQLQAFAAPRTDGIWDEIRDEIAQSVTQQGGAADDLPGPFGRELLARLPVRTPEGRTGHRPARFVGADGPRWFLRGVITGRAAVEPEAARALEQVFAAIVVVRDGEARPPRDLLPLQLPEGAAPVPDEAEPEPAEPSFDPLTRGPEITEIR